jgi:hypothetical protein
VCSVLSNLLYQFPQFPVSLENKKNGGFASVGPPQGSMTGPENHALCYRLPVLQKVFHLLFKF